ncbi:MAG: hypothetical protein NXI27_24285 [Alphaproteobacteria bacterium]|nr:hypothetical protein [Alphaproteobacteria bacterium]
MIDHILSSLTQDAPPNDLSLPLQALWWLKKGDLRLGKPWEKAHAICQTAEGNRPYDLVHALVHLIEGDAPNAAYWYRRAGTEQSSDNLSDEWHAIAGFLTK